MSLAQKARTNVTSCAQSRQEKKAQTTEETKKYYEMVCDKLTELILKDWKDKVEKASEKGYWKTNIFQYFDEDRFDGDEVGLVGSNLHFLLKGTKAEGLKVWESKGIKPVMTRVKEEVEKEECTMKFWFTGRKNGTVIEVCWEPIVYWAGKKTE